MEDATAKTTMAETKPLQLFVRLLAGKTATLSFTTKNVYAEAIKRRIYEITRIPIGDQRLIYSGRQLEDSCVISDRDATIHLSLRLLGGKGGFGSLLRGAATKAGQKKTNNFDACRDMSGRRLRHVNAEKKLEEWKAGEEERRMEKMAEEFLKKKSKKGKGKGESRETERYVEKYREESGKCVAAVEEAVREAIGGLKRKGKEVPKEEAKKFKIWMGKRAMDESDSDDMEERSSEEDSDEENEKSIVLNNGNHSDSSKELEGSSGSVTGGKQVREFSGVGSSESNSEEEKEITVKRNSESGGSSGEEAGHDEENGVAESLVHEESLEVAANSGPEAIEAEKQYCNGPESGNLEEVVGQLPSGSNSGDGEGIEIKIMGAEANCSSKSESEVKEETVVASANAVEMEKPLNFDDFNSAAEMEALGMERLKSELQTHGLKCGGTLQERAARLFLLKSTPLEMLPKKLLAKK